MLALFTGYINAFSPENLYFKSLLALAGELNWLKHHPDRPRLWFDLQLRHI